MLQLFLSRKLREVLAQPIRYNSDRGSIKYTLRNREIVTARFQEVLAAALRVPKKRRPTRPTAASKAKRIESKKRRGQIKQLRRAAPDE
jgi:hypothetical protein